MLPRIEVIIEMVRLTFIPLNGRGETRWPIVAVTTVVDVFRTSIFLITVERHLVPLRLKRRLVLVG